MPTMAEYAASGGYARDAQAARNVANMPSPSYSSGSSSSRSSSGNSSQMTPIPYNPTQQSGYFPGSSTQTGGGIPAPAGSGGYMNVPTAGGGSGGGTPPMPSSYQVGDVTYTPGPANWGGMSQSQRDSYGSSLSGGAMPQNNSNNGMLFPPKPNGRGPGGVVGAEGGWADGTFYAPLQTPQQGAGGIWSPQQGNKNYQVTADMGMGGKTPPPYSATQGAGNGAFPAFQSSFDKAAAEKSAAEQATARIAKMQLGVQQGVDKYNTARKNALDYTNQTTKDNRVLAASMFNRNNDPFSGGTLDRQSQILRSNNLEDTAANNNYQADVGANNQKLTDFMTAAPEQQQAMYDQLLQQLQNTANQQDQVALQARGQDMSQSNADRSFGLQKDQFQHTVGQDNIANNHWKNTFDQTNKQNDTANNHWQNTFDQGTNQWDKTFNQNQTNSDRTFNAGRQDALANSTGFFNPTNMNANQINQEIAQNSAAYANASKEQQQQLHARNGYLNGLLGKTDSTGNGDYVGGNPDGQVGYKTTQRQQLDNQAKETAYSHTRDLIKDTQYQQTFDYNFKKDGLDFALRQATLDNQITNDQAMRAIQQYNAATSRMGASTSAASQGTAAARLAWDKDPNNPDNIYKTSQSNKHSNAVDPKVSSDNYSFYMSQINGKAKNQAEAYIQSQSMNLSDQDYRDLLKYVREKL